MAPRRRALRALKIPRAAEGYHRSLRRPPQDPLLPRAAEGCHRSRRRPTQGPLLLDAGPRAILWGQQGHFVPHGANVDADAALVLAKNALLFGYQEDIGHNLAPVLPMGPQLEDGEFEELQDLFGIGADHNLPPVLLPIGPQLLEGELEELYAIFGAGLQYHFGIGDGHNMGLLQELRDLFGIEELQDLFDHNLVPVPPFDPQLLNGELGELPDPFGIGAGNEDAVYEFELDEAFDLDDLLDSLEDYNPFSVLLDIEKASEFDADPQAIRIAMLRDQNSESPPGSTAAEKSESPPGSIAAEQNFSARTRNEV